MEYFEFWSLQVTADTEVTIELLSCQREKNSEKYLGGASSTAYTLAVRRSLYSSSVVTAVILFN